MAYQALEKLINLHDGYRKAVRLQDRQLLLLHEEGQTMLIDRSCPHAGQMLDSAPVAAGCITCPRHQISFSLRNGQAQRDECRALGVYSLAYEGNSVGIDI